jgi:predicted peroxiredoxin
MMSERLIFNCTHGKEDPERATLPFVAANIAATAGQDAVVLCTIDAVWLGTEGGTEGIAQEGLPVLSDLYAEFVDNGGQVWLCGACTKPRGITEEQVRKGSTIVGAAKVVEEVVAGAKTVAFA